MSVWLTIPSARPAAIADACFRQWKSLGYKVAVLRDDSCDLPHADLVPILAQYPGYAKAVNMLVRTAIAYDSAAEWFVIGGDDVYPDPSHSADEIAAECRAHFGEKGTRRFATFGVMQPTGDQWGDAQGPYIERVAGSAWIGRGFALHVYDGLGPLWPEYTHMFVDEELQCVAEHLGVFWQRPDLVHRHEHCLRRRALPEDLAPHLRKWNTPEHWRQSKALFERRKAAGFPALLEA